MNQPRSSRSVILVFAFAGVLGPGCHLLWRAAGGSLRGLGRFAADFAALLWPAQPLAVIEASTGPVVALVVAVGVNVGLFSLVGWVVGGLAGHRKALGAFYFVVAGGAVALELLWAGYDWKYVRYAAMVAALVLHAALFVAAERLNSRDHI